MASKMRRLIAWRYSMRSHVRHALRLRDADDDEVFGPHVRALCGERPPWRDKDFWRGADTQVERDTLAALPECSRCQKKLGGPKEK